MFSPISSNNPKYVGSSENGLAHGTGVVTDGRYFNLLKGTFKNGYLVSGLRMFPGKIESGGYVNNFLRKGWCYTKNKYMRGTFENGKIITGSICYPNFILEGKFNKREMLIEGCIYSGRATIKKSNNSVEILITEKEIIAKGTFKYWAGIDDYSDLYHIQLEDSNMCGKMQYENNILVNCYFGISEKYCVVCLERLVNTVFLCGHMCVCDDCGVKLDKCPMCRDFGTVIKVYIF